MTRPAPSAFGKRLRKLRTAAGLTQAALGKAAGVHPVSIAQYETGVCQPSEKSAEKLEAYFKGLPDKPADPQPAQAPAKKRGRPRKVRAEKTGRPRLPAGPVLSVVDQGGEPPTRREIEKAVLNRAEVGRNKKVDSRKREPPARLGQVSLAWVEQQVASYVHARGTSFADGQACVVVLRRRDVIELGKTLIEACGMRVGEE